MADESHASPRPPRSRNDTSNTQESLSFTMKRFLKNREDKIWLSPEQSSQDAARRNRLQSVIDRVDQLGLSGKEGESKADK